MQFTEEQKQALQEATEVMIEAAGKIAASIVKIAETIVQAVAAAAKEFCEYISKNIAVIYKTINKLKCNNWRRMHGMPLLRRSKRSRQGQRNLYITG